jgi:TRAP-type C4-dicarboxylate transport system substrate-binding protein
MKRHPLPAILAASLALLAGCDSSTNKATGGLDVDPLVLTLANWQRGDSDVGEWSRAVARLSDGAMRIEIRGRWRRGEVETDRGTLEDVRAGRVDIGHIAARAWDTLGVDALRALDAPLLVDSLELERRVLASDLGAEMLDAIRAADVEPLALMPGPLMHPIGLSRDLLGPADYQGALIGQRPSATHEATMRALGARVKGVVSAGGLEGLDGTDIDLAGAEGEKYDRQARSVTVDVALWPRATTLVMNQDAWDDLTDEQRAVLEEAGRVALTDGMARERRYDRGGTQALCDRGFKLARAGAVELAALRRAVEPVYTQLERDGDTRVALDAIRSLKEDAPAAPVPSCRSREDRRPVPEAASEVFGTWQVHVSRKELAEAPRLRGERVFDNWGGISLELGANGHFEMRNDRYPGQIIGLGDWTADGDVLVFTPGGDLNMGAGETWLYRWTVFRDSLVLHRLSEDAGPTVLIVAPLRRR